MLHEWLIVAERPSFEYNSLALVIVLKFFIVVHSS